MSKVKTYFCCITMNRFYQLREVIENIYPYVDHVIVIDGGSVDGTAEGLDNITCIENKDQMATTEGSYLSKNKDTILTLRNSKVIMVESKWTDNFPVQRQKYLDVVGGIREPDEISWVIVSDSDEYFSPRLCKGIPKLLKEYAIDNNIEGFGVRCRGVTFNEKGEREHVTLDDFWKPLIYRWQPDLKIVGTDPKGNPHNVHEGFNKPIHFINLPAYEDQIGNELLYEHRKDPGDVWQRAHARNFYAGGGGPNLGEMQPLWKPFRELVEKCMVEDGWDAPKTWWDYDAYLKKGNISNKLKEWFIEYMFEGQKDRPQLWEATIEGCCEPLRYYQYLFKVKPFSKAEKQLGRTYDGSSEVREGYKYYFRFLHPMEEPEELKELHIG